MQVELPVSGPAHDASAASARLAIFLSAAVCPGAGHFVQRRWILGVLFLAAFVACLVMTLLAVVVPLMMNLRITLDFAEKGSSEIFRTISLVKVLTWFGLAILVYLAALVDIIAYARRQARRRLGARQKNLEQKD
jgi:glucan phosphoethanolaminetransferase (alkaline phosphatase superfamily)